MAPKLRTGSPRPVTGAATPPRVSPRASPQGSASSPLGSSQQGGTPQVASPRGGTPTQQQLEERIRELEAEVAALRAAAARPPPAAVPAAAVPVQGAAAGVASTPKQGLTHYVLSPSSQYGQCITSEGTVTPDASPLLLPARGGRQSAAAAQGQSPAPTPGQQFRLSSQVLTVGPYGIKQTTLLQVLRDARGRPDRRGADTPRVKSAAAPGRHSDPGADPDGRPPSASSDQEIDAADRQLTEGDDGVVRPRHMPASKSPPPPLDSAAVGRAAIDGPLNGSLSSLGSPILPMTPGALDRIATVFSLEALRSDKMLAQHIPQTARAAMDYVSKSFNLETGQFEHNLDRLHRIVVHLVDEVVPIMSKEPLYQKVRSPCYVFGDIHGNFRDLHYFLNNIVNFQDLHYTPSNVLFLGDYVDRGPYGLECTILLLALKLSCPGQVTMLRGNHEDPLVNGDIRHYGNTAFLKQCQSLFGAQQGHDVWKRVNEVFRQLPLAADIDDKIFCTHGGLPRYNGGYDDRLEMLRSAQFPRLEYFSVFDDCDDEEQRPWIQMACDLCWSDPKEDESDAGGYWGLNEHGFARNTRGQGTLSFGTQAVDFFLRTYGFEYIFRAHQEKSDGLRLSKSGRVLTIFSTSDYEGHRNGAALVFVNHKSEIRMIIKQPT
eukprot:TRINITY_DN2184_c2_g1_i1.p1 TRINITY_DN2184_c2_g1~~TRINITY_DN2184_c2_g1_i1.p1  ORF type:complete len:691 (+),score=219.33 TRINITY_DN2184_c2_g1_i1:98-2074(+)